MPKGPAAVAFFLVCAVVLVALAVMWFTVNTSFLASATGHHAKHGILALVLAVLCLVAASFARPRTA